MKKTIVVAILSLSVFVGLNSCKPKPHYAYTVKEIFWDEEDTTTIYGQPAGLSIEGYIWETLLVDSLFIVQVEEPDGFLSLYNINDMKLSGHLCQKGRARNEFSFPFFLLPQSYSKNNDNYIVCVDRDSYVKEINLTKSIEEGRTIVTNLNDCPSYFGNDRFLFLNNDISHFFLNSYGEESSERKRKEAQYWIVNTDTKDRRRLDVFPKKMDSDEEGITNYAGGSIYKNPDKNLIIQECCFMDYLLFFDVDADTAFAVHISGKPTFDDMAPDGGTITFASGSTVSSDYIFALYVTLTVDQNGEEYEKITLFILDWDGELKANAVLSPSVNNVVFDKKNNVLYGFDFSDVRSLYKFDLQEIISRIND